MRLTESIKLLLDGAPSVRGSLLGLETAKLCELVDIDLWCTRLQAEPSLVHDFLLFSSEDWLV